MTLSRAFALAAALTGLLGFAPTASAEVKIKLGTLAPNGSPWHNLLKEMGQKWSDASGGQVKLVIYAGGVLGNEGDLVKKINIGQIQSAALTTVGLHDITPEPQTIDVPMMIGSFAELDYVREREAPKLEKALEAKGFVVLGWSEVGFARFFSTKKYATIEDFTQKAKVFGWEGDPASADAWRAAGFKPVVMSSTDIVPSLQTGLIDTIAMSPLYAFTGRFFERAKYMLDLPWGVLTGANVVKKDVWEKIPADLRPKLLEIGREYARKVSLEVRRMDDEALKTMITQGLEVVKPVNPDAFKKAALQSWTVVRGRVVPPETFDEVKKLVEEARAKAK
jgi:TRAP-type C4-dicarboxylate transport system substrate-binding protein